NPKDWAVNDQFDYAQLTEYYQHALSGQYQHVEINTSLNDDRIFRFNQYYIAGNHNRVTPITDLYPWINHYEYADFYVKNISYQFDIEESFLDNINLIDTQPTIENLITNNLIKNFQVTITTRVNQNWKRYQCKGFVYCWWEQTNSGYDETLVSKTFNIGDEILIKAIDPVQKTTHEYKKSFTNDAGYVQIQNFWNNLQLHLFRNENDNIVLSIAHDEQVKINGWFDTHNGKIEPQLNGAKTEYTVENNYPLTPESIVNLSDLPELIYFNNQPYDGNALLNGYDVMIQFTNWMTPLNNTIAAPDLEQSTFDLSFRFVINQPGETDNDYKYTSKIFNHAFSPNESDAAAAAAYQKAYLNQIINSLNNEFEDLLQYTDWSYLEDYQKDLTDYGWWITSIQLLSIAMQITATVLYAASWGMGLWLLLEIASAIVGIGFSIAEIVVTWNEVDDTKKIINQIKNYVNSGDYSELINEIEKLLMNPDQRNSDELTIPKIIKGVFAVLIWKLKDGALAITRETAVQFAKYAFRGFWKKALPGIKIFGKYIRLSILAITISIINLAVTFIVETLIINGVYKAKFNSYNRKISDFNSWLITYQNYTNDN
ncbi:MAG: hypothetical protein LBC33_02985, partial [Mycoplasmataceae bacterium]|nr:hypothetical protein [Mycoplasmataceae bacterium]